MADIEQRLTVPEPKSWDELPKRVQRLAFSRELAMRWVTAAKQRLDWLEAWGADEEEIAEAWLELDSASEAFIDADTAVKPWAEMLAQIDVPENWME